MSAPAEETASRPSDGYAHWMLFAALAPPLAQWATVILIARVVGAADLGAYVLANAIATPVVLIMQLPLRSVYVVHKSPTTLFESYLSLRIVMLCIAFLLAVMIGKLSGVGTLEFGVIAALAIARCAESTSDILYAPLQRDARLSLIAKLTVWRTGLGLFASGVLLLQTGSILLSAVALAASNCAAVAMWEWPTRRLLYSRLEQPAAVTFAGCYKLARQAIPLSMVQTLTALGGNAPRYIVQWGRRCISLGILCRPGTFRSPDCVGM